MVGRAGTDLECFTRSGGTHCCLLSHLWLEPDDCCDRPLGCPGLSHDSPDACFGDRSHDPGICPWPELALSRSRCFLCIGIVADWSQARRPDRHCIGAFKLHSLSRFAHWPRLCRVRCNRAILAELDVGLSRSRRLFCRTVTRGLCSGAVSSWPKSSFESRVDDVGAFCVRLSVWLCRPLDCGA